MRTVLFKIECDFDGPFTCREHDTHMFIFLATLGSHEEKLLRNIPACFIATRYHMYSNKYLFTV